MGQRIAEGDIQVNVLDERALADLKRVETQFDRTMSHIDHAEAKARIEADIAPLEDKLKNARRKLKELEGQRTQVKAGLDTSALDRGIAQARKDIKRLDGQKATMEVRLKGAEKALAASKAMKAAELDRIEAINAAERQSAKVFEDAEKRRMAQVNQSARVSATLNKQREREMASAHTAALKEDRDRELALRRQQQEIDNIPTLKRQYAELAVNLDRLAKARRKATDEKVETAIDFKIAEAEGKMVALKKTLERLGSPVSLEVNIRPGRAMGQHIRQALESGGLRGAAHVAGMSLGDAVVSGFRKRFSRQAIGNTIQGGLQRVGDVLGNISSATVRLGPFTTTIRGMIGILGILGPTILDVVGALGSLVSVAGAAALGAGALGVAFAGGAIPAVIGFIGVIKPMIAEFQNAKKASDAYNAAVLKYGENSKQAKKANQQLTQTLQGTDKSTVSAFKSATQLSARWKDLTAPARAAGFNVIGDAINFASKNMGWFARATNDGFKTASDGVRAWIKGLGSGEGKSILTTMMNNFNSSIQPVMHGLGEIATFLGRIGKSASQFLPTAAHGFDAWATKLADSVSNGAKLDGTMARLMASAKSVGQFFMAAGRFLVSFFNPGVEAGERLTDTMTNALNRWTALNNSTRGRNNLAQFFQQSVTGAQNLYAAFAPVLSSFVRWAALMAPAVSGFLRGAGAVSKFVSGIANLLQLQGGLSTLAATMGALWAVGRISAATRAIAGFAAALGGVRKAQEVSAGVSGIESLAGGLAGGGALKGAGKAAGEATLLRKAAILAVPAIAEMGEVAAAASTGGLALVAGAAVYGTYKLLSMKDSYQKLKESIANSTKPIGQFTDATKASGVAAIQVGTAQRSYGAALSHVAAYKAKLNRLESEGKKNTQEYKNTVDQLNGALMERQQTEQQLTTARTAMVRAQNAQVDADNKLVPIQKNLNKAQQDYNKWVDENRKSNTPESRQMLKDATRQLANAQEAYNKQLSAQKDAAMQAAVNAIQYQRAVKGLVPAAQGAAQALARLYQKNSKLATTIAVRYQDPKDAGAVASRANSALRAGVSQKIVTKIVADSSNADQAIRRLTGAARSLEARKFSLKLGASDQASATISSIVKKVNSMPEGRAKIKAIDAATTTIAHIISRITGVPDKTARLIARDLISGKVQQAKSLIAGLKDKSVTLSAHANLSQAQQLIALQNSLRDKSVTWTTKQNIIKSNRDSTRAAGRGPGGREQAWVGEGSRWQGAKELIADHATGAVQSVDKPTLMSLSPTQSVIPVEESKHRGRGRKLMEEFAKDMGFERFSSGRTRKKKPKASTNTPTQKYRKARLTDYGKLKQRGHARGIAGRNTSFDPDTMPEMKAVAAAKTKEDNQSRQISIEESKLQEPDTFLIQTGTDKNGDPIYDIDNRAVSDWSSKLTNIAGMYQALMNLIDSVVTAVGKALTALHSVESSAEGNISRIGGRNGPLARDRAIADGRGVSPSRKAGARERIRVYEDYLRTEHEVLTGAQAADADMVSENTDAGYRKQEAQVSRDQYNTDAAAVAGKAAADKQAQNPQPEKPDAPPTPLDIATGAVDAIDANDALASIGQGTATSDADKIRAYQNIIDVARGMLSDSDPSNDSSAYSAIQSAAGSIHDIQTAASDASAASTASAYQNSMGSSSARQDLFTNFANNFGGAAFSTTPSGFGGGAFGANASSSGAGPAGGARPTVVNVVNNFAAPPPDPHTFSQGLGFELQAAV